jgi:2,4-dienoyl-CoA reductase-like NADH-dependent reductase (Old Yellow Enzyme family)
VRLPNRVVSTSHQTGLIDRHLPTDALVAYHQARARGGVGAIFLEAAAVHPSGLLTPATLGGYLPEVVTGYRRLSDAVHESETKIFVQLFHGGREQITAPPSAPAVAPSAVPSARFGCEPRRLTVGEIRELINGYALAARHAQAGGLDGIEISMAHGYLLAQFFSPVTNRRTDAYGGDLEARLLLAREVLGAVREAVGTELAVGVRLSADEVGADLLGEDQCREVAEALTSETELDFVSLALGNSSTYAASTWIAPPPPAAENVIFEHAGVIRAALRPTPTLLTTRIVDLEDAEQAIASGAAELVGMTRALIADPGLVEKAKGSSREPVIECIGCNQACIGHYHAGVPIACVANVRTGREGSLPSPRRSAPGRRVLVIGGGPAGVAAAIEAACWGDAVEIRERSGELGGQLRLAGSTPAHREVWERWRRNVQAQLARHGVLVQLESEVADLPDPESWDLVILATGARPHRPPLPTPTAGLVISAWDAIEDPLAAEGPVMVVDWGVDWAGLDASEALRLAGRDVTLVCAGLHPGMMLHQYQRALYLSRLDSAGVAIIHHAELTAEGGDLMLRNVFSGRTMPSPEHRTLVLAAGREPEDGLWQQLENLPRVVRAGDVLGPRTLEEATLEGTIAACPGPALTRLSMPWAAPTAGVATSQSR